MTDSEPIRMFGDFETENAGHVRTNRGIAEYAKFFGMDWEKFLEFIGGKKILDCGASGGRLAKEVILLKMQGKLPPETTVYSLDLSYTTEQGRKEAEAATHLAFTALGARPTKEDIETVNAEFNATSIPSNYRKIDYPDGFFDIAFGNHSLGLRSKDKNALFEAYREFGRVSQEGFITVLPVLGLENFYFVRDRENKKIYYRTDEIAFLNPVYQESTFETDGVKEKISFLHTSKSKS